MAEENEFIKDFKNAFPDFKNQDLSQISLETLKGLSKMIGTDTALSMLLSSKYEQKGIPLECFTVLISFVRDYPLNITAKKMEKKYLSPAEWFNDSNRTDERMEKLDKILEDLQVMLKELKEANADSKVMMNEIRKNNSVLTDIIRTRAGNRIFRNGA